MENRNLEITPTELLFLIHPNSCTGLELVKITVLNLAFLNQINIYAEKRLITRKRAGNIEQLFFIIEQLPKRIEMNSYESVIYNNTKNAGNILQHYIRGIDKKLNGIEVFKYEVYKELAKKGLLTSSFTLFGLLTPKYKVTQKGSLVKKSIIEKENMTNFVFHIISSDKTNRIKEFKEIEEFIPSKFKELIFMKNKDWDGVNKRSGLNPSGFLPI